MEWKQHFLEKENWQRNTFNKIKNDLTCAKGNRFLKYENSAEDHLVIVYGKPQVGKTTLILSMIGLRDDCFSEVYETLRAGITRGNSSTSTAIIYSRSRNNQYGCVLAPLDDIQSREMHYCDKGGIIEELSRIRSEVESNRISAGSILFISIPDNYFVQETSKDLISILDLPGVGSRNHREDLHLQRLLSRYIPVASVCVIVCGANDIVSLKTTTLPNNIDWKRQDHRFILAITKAYSDGTTKRYFDTARQERDIGFYEYVKEAYAEEICKILGQSNKTEIYPLELGTSMGKFCQNVMMNEEDRKEIIDTKNRVLADLHNSIAAHKGERLKSALMDLSNMAEHYREEEEELISKEEEAFREKIRLIEKKQANSRNNLRELFQEFEDVDGIEKDFEEKKEVLEYKLAEYAQSRKECQKELSKSAQGFKDDIIGYVEKQNLYKYEGSCKVLADDRRQMLTFMHKKLSERVSSYNGSLRSIVKKEGINEGDCYFITASTLYDKCIVPRLALLYPRRRGLFAPKETVSLEKVSSVCETIQKEMYNLFSRSADDCSDRLREKIDETKWLQELVSKELRKLQKYPEEKKKCEQEIEILRKELNDISEKKEQDKKTLALYLEYARNAYLEQRAETIRRINECSSAEEGLMQVLFLGVLDKDYQKVTGGFNEGRY